MGTYTFQWPYKANEVFVTGTFDDWGKTVKLDRVGNVFSKEISLPKEKVQYKFVVDGIWTTDKSAREENDGKNNINNVLLPEEIIPTLSTATMSGVTPESTTAALAANASKEPNANLPGTFPETPLESEQILSVNPIPASAGPSNPITLKPGEKVPDLSSIHGNTVESTVKLDKESYEKSDSLPLGSTNALAGSDASAFVLPPISSTSPIIPESSLSMGGPAQQAAAGELESTLAGGPAQQAAAADPGFTIQSAAPTSTTAALAAEVPLEKDIKTNGSVPVSEVPDVVKESMAEAGQAPEAAAFQEAVDEKNAMEKEFQKKVDLVESAGEPAPTITAATTETAPSPLPTAASEIAPSSAATTVIHSTETPSVAATTETPSVAATTETPSVAATTETPSVAATTETPSAAATTETPSAISATSATTDATETPSATATTTDTAPTVVTPAETQTETAPSAAVAPTSTGLESNDISPHASSPAVAETSAPKSEPATEATGPIVTNGVDSAAAAEVTTPVKPAANLEPPTKEQKKKNRLSGFFDKLKEKLK